MINITPTEILEYYFCPRFIYFMNVLHIPQYEDRRFKVQKGRDIHEKRQRENPDYLWKKINVVKRLGIQQLTSKALHLNGIPDDIVILDDGSYAPVDYKYAIYPDYVYKGHRMQIGAYALLIENIYQVTVSQGFIFYIRDGSKVARIPFSDKLRQDTLQAIGDILKITEQEKIPDSASRSVKCMDCTYKNICVI